MSFILKGGISKRRGVIELLLLLVGMHKLNNEDYLLFEKVECEK